MALKSLYPLYSNLSDSVGGNTGTDVNANVTFSAVGPAPGSALFSSSRVTAAASPIVGNWTISFEALRTAAANNNGSIVEIGTLLGSGFGVAVWSDDGAFGIPNGGTSWWVNTSHLAGADYIATNVALPINVAVETLYTYDGSNVYSWINGELKSTIAFSTNPSTASTVCIGDRFGAAGNYFNGRLSRLYTDDTFTSAADVKNQYAGRHGFF